MAFRVLFGLALAVTPLAAASSMPVGTFLTKAEALQKKGAMAIFSRDLKLLLNHIKADLTQIRTERLVAKAAGNRMIFCPPAAGAKLTDKDILGAMQAVPQAQRSSMSTKVALEGFLARRYPCP